MNSAHQLWSRWTATITPTTAPPFDVVKDNCARFYRKAFGAATELRITATPEAWTIDCRTEGHPVHEPAYVSYLTRRLAHFFAVGFGADARVHVDVRLEAGDRQDGTPPDQLILGPAPVVRAPRLLKEK